MSHKLVYIMYGIIIGIGITGLVSLNNKNIIKIPKVSNSTDIILESAEYCGFTRGSTSHDKFICMIAHIQTRCLLESLDLRVCGQVEDSK